MNFEVIEILDSVLNSKGRKLKKQNEYMYWSPFVSHHKPKLQVNIETGKWHCWVSNQGGHNLFQLLKRIGASRTHYQKLSEIVGDTRYVKKEEKEYTLKLPDEFIPLWDGETNIRQQHALMFLHNRGLTYKDILKYGIGYCSEGLYGNRVIVPSYDSDGQLNYFVGRDFYNSKMKYKNPPIPKDVIGFDLYINWDEPIVLCEGVFDAIAIKRNAIPMFGKTIPKKLFKKIIEKNVKKVFLMLDEDAKSDSIKITENLINFGIDVIYIAMEDGDPSDLGYERSLELIKSSSKITFKELIGHKLNGKTKRYMEI